MSENIRWLSQTAAVGLFAAALTVSSSGNANLVRNGDFTNDTSNTSFSGDAYWSSSGSFVYIYGPGGADAIGVNGTYLWGPNNPVTGPNCSTQPGVVCNSENGLPETSKPPNGGNYLAADSDHNFAGPISQVIPANTLTANKDYVLSFEFAAAQYRALGGEVFSGKTSSGWQVTLGGAPLIATSLLPIDSHGFSGWQTETVSFLATAADAAGGFLTFLAISPNVGVPPVALLDSVSIVPAPEPTSLALLAAGLASLGLVRRRRYLSGSRSHHTKDRPE